MGWRRVVIGMGGVALGLLAACDPFLRVTTIGAPRAPRESGCQFLVLTAPTAGYVEIGSIEFRGGLERYTDLAELESAIRGEMCRAGADAALPWTNQEHEYIKVTMLERTSVAPPSVATSAAPNAAPNAATNAATSVATNAASSARSEPASGDLGCHYDTQCKGDRVCSDGKCAPPDALPVSPTAPRTRAAAPSAR